MISDIGDSGVEMSSQQLTQHNFIEQVYASLVDKKTYTQIQKTSIGVQSYVKVVQEGQGLTDNQSRELQMGQWAHELRDLIFMYNGQTLPLMMKFFELRPYQYGPL